MPVGVGRMEWCGWDWLHSPPLNSAPEVEWDCTDGKVVIWIKSPPSLPPTQPHSRISPSSTTNILPLPTTWIPQVSNQVINQLVGGSSATK